MAGVGPRLWRVLRSRVPKAAKTLAPELGRAESNIAKPRPRGILTDPPLPAALALQQSLLSLSRRLLLRRSSAATARLKTAKWSIPGPGVGSPGGRKAAGSTREPAISCGNCHKLQIPLSGGREKYCQEAPAVLVPTEFERFCQALVRALPLRKRGEQTGTRRSRKKDRILDSVDVLSAKSSKWPRCRASLNPEPCLPQLCLPWA